MRLVKLLGVVTLVALACGGPVSPSATVAPTRPGPSLPPAEALAAMLPDLICESEATKIAMNGTQPQLTSITPFLPFLASTGKTRADVFFAGSAAFRARIGCPGLTALRIRGVDQADFQSYYLAMVTTDGLGPVQKTIAGKPVIQTTDGQYAYISGDILFQVRATSDDNAATGLDLLP